jgi:hypothetical protein
MFGKGALILVVGIGVIFGIFSKRLARLNNDAIENMAYYHDVNKSHTLASVGANIGVSKVYQDSTVRGVVSTQTFTSGIFTGGSFTSRVESTASTIIRMRSVSTFKSYSDTVEVYFDRSKFQSFSMFAWMTNDEGGVYWITRDTVWGRVHSNGQINISGSPTFIDKVTTSKAISPKPGTGTSLANYKKGYETGVGQILFPTDISELVNASTSGGKKYTYANTWITLSAGTSADGNGKAYIRTSAGGSIVDSVILGDPSFNGVIYGTNNVHVQGTLDGRLSIGAGNNITVEDNVVYEQNPLNGSSNDMLGLVADQSVIVADNTANRSDCEIDASIFCRTGSYSAENYSSRPVSGTLKIIGGVIQNTRGAVGTFSGSTLVSGFSKRYYFDPRLGDPNVRPPFFPGFYKKTLAIKNWWENVRIPKM